MANIIRDSLLGSLVNWASGGRWLPYADQRADYALPAPANAFLVAFEANDPDRPLNFSLARRVFSGGLIMLLTASVYIGSAIYTSSIPGVEQHFCVAPVVGTLGLSLFILGYALGPLVLGPVADAVSIGRTPVYIASLAVYILLHLPVVFAPNIGTLLAFRFLAGFAGSPALSVGPTSMTELFRPSAWPYAISSWNVAATMGPVLGPVVGGFAALTKGWRWPVYELMWLCTFTLGVLLVALPETSEKTILHRRATCLRKLTGNDLLKTRHELDYSSHASIARNIYDNFLIGLRITADPAVLFANTYLGLVYGILYLWFEIFPLVFQDIHHFNLGLSGLPFLGFVVTQAITFTLYALYNRKYLEPRSHNDPTFGPHTRLEVGLVAGWFIPISLLIFGWGAHSHWSVSVIGAALFNPGVYMLFQSILVFLSSYVRPEYTSAVMAANNLFRSGVAAAFPLFARPFVAALGVGPACTLLAGVALVMIPILYLLYRKVPSLRMKSKWANDGEKVDPHVAGH